MKKIAIVFILLVSYFSFIPPATAQEENPEATTGVEATEESEYKLPYPGMLPDSRFYKLKTLRDKLILFLIRDPYKKAEKHLHLADRMLYESLKVAEKGKIALATHNAFKGEHHMTQLVDSFKSAVYSGREFNKTLAERAHEAAVMHKKLLIGMTDRAETEDEKYQFATIIEFSERNDKELFKLEREATAEPELQFGGESPPQEIQ